MREMEKLNAKKIIKDIENKKDIIRKIGVKKIGLFGSFVKGKQNKRSDVDILVEFEKVTFDNYFLLKELLERLFKRKIDLIIEKDLRHELNYVKKGAEYAKI